MILPLIYLRMFDQRIKLVFKKPARLPAGFLLCKRPDGWFQDQQHPALLIKAVLPRPRTTFVPFSTRLSRPSLSEPGRPPSFPFFRSEDGRPRSFRALKNRPGVYTVGSNSICKRNTSDEKSCAAITFGMYKDCVNFSLNLRIVYRSNQRAETRTRQPEASRQKTDGKSPTASGLWLHRPDPDRP